MPELSKLQIRAKVLSVISRIKSLSHYNEEILSGFVEDLNEIEDKHFLFDTYIKEFLKLDEKDYVFSSLLLKQVVPVDYINEQAINLMKSETLSDEVKYKLIQLLRITGGNFDYNSIPSYFDNPEGILDKETKRLLETAVFNPESMLDFLDFVSAVSVSDRDLLLESLKEDYQGDVLANIVYPILYSDFEDEFKLKTINILSESKSSLAIAPFEFLINVSDNKDIKNACETGLKKLKLSGADKKKADEYFRSIVQNSKPAEFFTTIPDGNGNQAFLISRKTDEGKYLLSATVTNDISGIVDCFGFFNIAQEEIIKIISKFYRTEGKYKVPPSYVKYRINKAINITVQNKNLFPYEFICWYPLISDIEPYRDNLEEYVNSACKLQNIEKDVILELLTKDYTFRWFITPGENDIIKNITDEIYNTEVPDIKEINAKIRSSEPVLFNEDDEKVWKERLYNLIYLLRTDGKLKDSDIFFTMLKDKEYYKLFKQILIQRSIFNYFVGLKENIKDSLLTTNIFKKRSSAGNKYDKKKVEAVIEYLKSNWFNG